MERIEKSDKLICVGSMSNGRGRFICVCGAASSLHWPEDARLAFARVCRRLASPSLIYFSLFSLFYPLLRHVEHSDSGNNLFIATNRVFVCSSDDVGAQVAEDLFKKMRGAGEMTPQIRHNPSIAC